MKLLLFSGIPLNLKSSFYWQLTLLRDGFEKKGLNVSLISPIPEGKAEFNNKLIDGILYTNYNEENALNLVYDYVPDAIILLGYPNDFLFLTNISDNAKLPAIYLWAQFSKTPVLNEFFKSKVIFVPLTGKTSEYCSEAKVKNISKPIPHGVPLDIYHIFNEKNKHILRDKLSLNNFFVIGTVAKNAIRKRLNDVIEAFSMVYNKIDDAFLIIKTDKEINDDGYNLNLLVEKYGLLDRTKIICGNFTRSKMADLYNCMDVYVQLSEWEGFGIPVIEAMACGLPVITHEVQGPGEIVNNTGIIVNSRKFNDDSGAYLSYADVNQVAEALYTLYKDNDLRNKLSKKAVSLIRGNYDINKVVDKWMKIL